MASRWMASKLAKMAAARKLAPRLDPTIGNLAAANKRRNELEIAVSNFNRDTTVCKAGSPSLPTGKRKAVRAISVPSDGGTKRKGICGVRRTISIYDLSPRELGAPVLIPAKK